MIRLEKTTDNKLIAHVTNEFGNVQNINISPFLMLGEDADRILQPCVRRINGYSVSSQVCTMRNLNQVGDAINKRKLTSLPRTENEWQDFVLDLYEFVLTRNDRKSRLQSRIDNWKIIHPLLELLRDEADIIPFGVEIPRAKSRVEFVDITSYRDQLLGERPPVIVDKEISKLLVDISLSRTDPQYLEEIRDKLAYRKRVLHEHLVAWWQQLKAHFEYGQRLLLKADWASIKSKIEDGHILIAEKRRRHFARGATEESLGDLLAILTYKHNSIFGKDTFQKAKGLPSFKIITLPETAPAIVSPLISRLDRLNWMLGNFMLMDIAICVGLLIMHNPVFTPHSLVHAKITDANGKPYLELTDLGLKYRIKKERAKSMKESVLDDLSIDIIETLLLMTKKRRAYLEQRDNPAANRLFISSETPNRHCPRACTIVKQLSGKGFPKKKVKRKTQSILDYMPTLNNAGLIEGTITLSKIRATEGVLEWFRTGSIIAMTKKLGNTKKVVLSHYLPKPLLAAWNTRLIRRFQNLWLIVAAANEEFLLEVTDFHTLEELHSFLMDMLSHHPATSSSLAEELHDRFSQFHESNIGSSLIYEKGDGSLAVPICINALAALYLYQESALAAGVDPCILDHPDVLNGLKPRQFLDLAELLRHQLSNHRDPKIRKSHDVAVTLVDGLRSRLRWTDLLLHRQSAYVA